LEVFIRPCTSGRSLEAIPSPPLRLDIDALEQRLEGAGWQPKVNATVLLIVAKEHEATIYQTGKVIFKSRDEAVARQMWAELSPHLEATNQA
jgi:hypothetical protein